MKSLLLSLALFLASFAVNAEDLTASKVRFCANMSTNYAALAVTAQIAEDNQEKEFKAMVEDQADKIEKQSGNPDLASIVKGLGMAAWANRKAPDSPVKISMMMFDSCVARMGIRT
jgi:hypothetical protein